MEFVRSNQIFSAEWLSEVLQVNVKSCEIVEGTKLGGLSGEMVYLSAQVEGEKNDLKLLLKKSPTGTSAMRVASGTAREALFYSKFSAKLGSIVSKAYWCHADMETGEMAILMECLQDCVPNGVFFGKGNPNNWGVSAEKTREASSRSITLKFAHI